MGMDDFSRSRNGQIFLANINKIAQSLEDLAKETKRANDLKEKELKIKDEGAHTPTPKEPWS